MYHYLTRVSDDLSELQVSIILDLRKLLPNSHGVLHPALRLIYFYLRSIRSGRCILHVDYETRRQLQAAADDNSHRPKASLESLLEGDYREVRVENAELPSVTSENMVRYDCVLRSELVGMFAGAVVFDHRWTALSI